MITLYGSGPNFGLPDGSPFVTKVEMLLKLAGLPFERGEMSFRKTPKGKIPYISAGGRLIGDSTLIRFHLEKTHGADFSGGYGARELAGAWAVEKMLEEHLYFLGAYERWCVDENFERGPAVYFDKAPAPLRPFVKAMIRRQVRKSIWTQGLGRHSDEERFEFGRRALDAVAELMGANRYFLGDRTCGADATVYAFLLGTLCPHFTTRLRAHAESLGNLTAYARRMTEEFYPEFSGTAVAA
jgi:glutathione S-transferase